MTRTQRTAFTISLSLLSAGFAMAQMSGGGMTGGGTKPGMMGGQMGSQMMEKMAGAMERSQGKDGKTVAEMSKMMDDMAGMMKTMAARMRDGRMDAALLKTTNDRLEVMGKSLAAMEPKPTAKS
jgi:hypothetical protein